MADWELVFRQRLLAELQQDLPGTSLERGVPAPGQPEGCQVLVATAAERETLTLFAQEEGEAFNVEEAFARLEPARARLYLDGWKIQTLHSCDPQVLFISPPTLTFEAVLAYRDERIVGYAMGYPRGGNIWAGNIWVAHDYRRRGIARELLATGRAAFSICQVLGPFSSDGEALIRSAAPELLATPGRNDPCPCGSGSKFKRCCLHEAPSYA